MFTNTLPADRTQQVVVVGGGITGLSAAWYLQKEAEKHNLSLNIAVLEQSDRWGGKVHTEQIDGFGDAPFILESGPDAFLTRKPWALALARELGLYERILTVNPQNNRTFVVNHGKPVPLPEGLQLLVPTKLKPFLQSPLFSLWGKSRILLEPLIPRKADSSDETLANFVRRRLGAEALDKLGEPLLAGVYNADPERQSMLATFPQFPALEKNHGSLLRGIRATRSQKPADSSPAFISFTNGTQELVDALVTQLQVDLRLNAAINEVQKRSDSGYGLTLASGEYIHADALVLAVPAKAAAHLLNEIAPEVADGLKAIRTASIGAVYLGFRREDVPHPLDGFGAVIPGSEGRHIDGMTWTSSKWDGRAPSGHVLLRVFFGGSRTRYMMDLNTEALVSMVRAELGTLLGIRTLPLFYRIFRWPDGYPQYDLGHIERVDAIEANLPTGIYLAGSSYRGVGVPDCIKQGKSAAERVIAQFLQRQPAQQTVP